MSANQILLSSVVKTSNINIFVIPLLPDREEGDEDEPDLPLLTTLDFTALKDVRQTGQEYCRQFEALLHNTPCL